jgi:hypothetical protein
LQLEELPVRITDSRHAVASESRQCFLRRKETGWGSPLRLMNPLVHELLANTMMAATTTRRTAPRDEFLTTRPSSYDLLVPAAHGQWFLRVESPLTRDVRRFGMVVEQLCNHDVGALPLRRSSPCFGGCRQKDCSIPRESRCAFIPVVRRQLRGEATCSETSVARQVRLVLASLRDVQTPDMWLRFLAQPAI